MKVRSTLAAAALSIGMLSATPAVISAAEPYQRFSTPTTLEERIAHARSAVFFNKTVTTGKVGEQDYKNEQKGTGFIYGDKYITVDHTVSVYGTRAPWGSTPITDRKEKTYIIIPGKGQFELKEIVNDPKNDIAVFQLPKEVCDMGYCTYKYPLKTKSEIKLGDEVYWSGNPLNNGHHFRRSYISRIKDLPDVKQVYKNSIGLGDYVINGSSGSPVFDKRTGALVGIIQFGAGTRLGSLGYMKSVDLILPYLNKTPVE